MGCRIHSHEADFLPVRLRCFHHRHHFPMIPPRNLAPNPLRVRFPHGRSMALEEDLPPLPPQHRSWNARHPWYATAHMRSTRVRQPWRRRRGNDMPRECLRLSILMALRIPFHFRPPVRIDFPLSLLLHMRILSCTSLPLTHFRPPPPPLSMPLPREKWKGKTRRWKNSTETRHHPLRWLR